jgi:molybdopterin-guanine dinucleotide biosynthesis protein A
MGRDKAALTYGDGPPQLERAMALLAAHVVRAYVSVRPDQAADPLRARFAQIVDTQANIGPIAGVLAAQAQHPQVAWLVVACDLPLLDAPTLAHLVAARDSARIATAYRSSHDGLPEPLCTIYEPGSRALLASYLEAGRNCPRKFLAQSDTLLLAEPNPRALDNINTPTEYSAVMSHVSAPKPSSSHAPANEAPGIFLFRSAAVRTNREDLGFCAHLRSASDRMGIQHHHPSRGTRHRRRSSGPGISKNHRKSFWQRSRDHRPASFCGRFL